MPLAINEKVVDKLVGELKAQLAEKQVSLELLPAARGWLAEHGFDAKFGARPMARQMTATDMANSDVFCCAGAAQAFEQVSDSLKC